MKLLYDANLSPALVDRVNDLFPDSKHIFDEGDLLADDPAIWEYAKECGFVIITKDSDFHHMSFVHHAPPKVVWLRIAVNASLIAADASKQRSLPGPEWNELDHSGNASKAIKDYLATLDDEAFGAASQVVTKFISPADPAAQWTGAHRGPAFFAYTTNYLIDVKCSVNLDIEGTRAIL